MPGLRLQSRAETARLSGIVSFEPVDGNPEALRHRLSRMKIFVAVRGTAIRISPHFYQGKPEIEHLLNGLEDAIKPSK